MSKRLFYHYSQHVVHSNPTCNWKDRISRRDVFVHNIYFTESFFKAFTSFEKTQFAK